MGSEIRKAQRARRRDIEVNGLDPDAARAKYEAKLALIAERFGRTIEQVTGRSGDLRGGV